MKHARLIAVVNAQILAVILGWAGSLACIAADLPGNPIIHIEDVPAFYKLYDRTQGHPTDLQLQHDYLDRGSAGLHRMAQLRNVTGASIAAAMAKHPDIYTNAKRCTAVLSAGRARVAMSMHKLRQLYPESQFPPVTIAVGRGKPVGVTDATGVMIGLESLCAVTWLESNLEDRFVHVVAHEERLVSRHSVN